MLHGKGSQDVIWLVVPPPHVLEESAEPKVIDLQSRSAIEVLDQITVIVDSEGAIGDRRKL
jgi:hypothetical protein